MILEMAKTIRNKEIIESICNIELHFFNNRTYKINLIPSRNNNIIIKYNKLMFKAKDFNGYQYICKYLLESIKKEVDEYVKVSIEWDNYDPETHDNFDKNLLTVSVKETTIFKEDFNIYSIPSTYSETILRHLLPLYYLTVVETF